MYPTLNRGDIVICDKLGWSGEGIYAIHLNGDALVKRLTQTVGKLMILSDNKEKYPPIEVKGENDDFRLIGRVHCAIKNVYYE